MIRDLMDIASRSIVQRNKKFLNKHKGEECYLFGNGVSLRSFDLYKFSDKISFGCSLLMLHKNISDLNIKYYVEHHPLVFSKYWRGTKTGMHIEKNPLYDFFHANSAKYEMFVHAIDYFSTKQYSNFNYIHNFKKHDLSLDTLDFSKSSSFVKGGLYSMIGLAIYMGFKKIYLVGCDYWFSPMMYTHFYDFKDELSVDCEFI